jgi:hypothetical protein
MINADMYLHTHLSNKGFLDDICAKLSEFVQKISNHFETIKIQGQIRDFQKSIDNDQREIECLTKKLEKVVPDIPCLGQNYDALSPAVLDADDPGTILDLQRFYQRRMLKSTTKINELTKQLIVLSPKYSSEIQSTIEK